MKKQPIKKKAASKGTRPQNGRLRVTTASSCEINNPDLKLSPEITGGLDRAFKAGQWLIAIFRVEQEQLFLDRTAMNFPKADVDLASRLFVENIQELKAK